MEKTENFVKGLDISSRAEFMGQASFSTRFASLLGTHH